MDKFSVTGGPKTCARNFCINKKDKFVYIVVFRMIISLFKITLFCMEMQINNNCYLFEFARIDGECRTVSF